MSTAVHSMHKNTTTTLLAKQVASLPIPSHLLNHAMEYSTTGVVVVDAQQADLPLIYVNVGFEKMTGYMRSEVLGHNCRFMQGKDTNKATIAQLKLAVQEERECQVTLLNYKKDGTPFWNELSIGPIYNDQGVLCYFMGSQKDVTEQMTVQKDLESSQKRINAVIESALDAVICIDIDSQIIEWNATATATFGWSREEAMGNNLLHMIVPAEFSVNYEQQKQLFLATGQNKLLNRRIETVAKRKDGTVFPMEMSIVPIKMNDEYMFNAFMRDITYQKEADQKQQELVSKLEEAVKELEMFSYSVSHDLRAPLRHVAGYANLLQKHSRTTLDAKGQRYLQTIVQAANNMGKLIDELLVFSRMGRTVLKMKTLNLNEIIEKVLYILEVDYKSRNIKFNIAALPTVQGDAVMFAQVFQNLLSNAIKYTRHQSPALVEVNYEVREKDYCFWVKDNGAGFDMKYQHKLFGVFQRLHTQDEFEGIGIGLANVKRIIKRHGGKIWAEAAPNQGATFYFTLPK